jgi:hypothetical protein
MHIHRAVMINPPVSLYASMNRLDRMFADSIGPGDAGLEQLYRRLYAQLANMYRASKGLPLDESFLLGAAALGLTSDTDMAAVVALSMRLTLINMFYLGDLSAGTGVLVDPSHPAQPGDPQAATLERLRAMPFSDYFSSVFTPYYVSRYPGSTADSLVEDNRLEIIGPQLRASGDYYAQTNSDDLILDDSEREWLKATLGRRLVVYDHGGHLGNLGERAQIADMLDMLAGRWAGSQ